MPTSTFQLYDIYLLFSFFSSSVSAAAFDAVIGGIEEIIMGRISDESALFYLTFCERYMFQLPYIIRSDCQSLVLKKTHLRSLLKTIEKTY